MGSVAYRAGSQPDRRWGLHDPGHRTIACRDDGVTQGGRCGDGGYNPADRHFDRARDRLVRKAVQVA
jgi:hypothetical protein